MGQGGLISIVAPPIQPELAPGVDGVNRADDILNPVDLALQWIGFDTPATREPSPLGRVRTL